MKSTKQTLPQMKTETKYAFAAGFTFGDTVSTGTDNTTTCTTFLTRTHFGNK